MTPLLQLRDLHAGYATVPAVRGVDLSVSAGEVVALLGRNGAGKTTTLLTIAGILTPLAGDVIFDGHSLTGVRPHRIAHRGVTLVPADRGIFRQLSVTDNLRLGRQPGTGRPATDVLDLFPALRNLLRRRAGLLSGGEQQMLALAKALVSGPRVLMVDELSLGLAPVVAMDLFPAITRIAREQNMAILLVEQHVHMALQLADRAYVMNRGALTLEGNAAELCKRMDILEASYLGLDPDAHSARSHPIARPRQPRDNIGR